MTLELAARSIRARYRESLLGIAWSVLNPLLLVIVYSFVFGVIFNARWSGPDNESASFAIILFAGLIPHSFLSEVFSKVPGIIAGNANFVKKLVFPLEILVPVELCAALFNASISCLVLSALHLYSGGVFTGTLFYAPLMLCAVVPSILGLSWFIAATSVYFRDMGQIIPIVTMLLLFLCPIFYPYDAIPDAYRSYLLLNPLTIPVEQFRAVLLFGAHPDWTLLGKYMVVTFTVMMIGFWWFQLTRKGFSDVI